MCEFTDEAGEERTLGAWASPSRENPDQVENCRGNPPGISGHTRTRTYSGAGPSLSLLLNDVAASGNENKGNRPQ